VLHSPEARCVAGVLLISLLSACGDGADDGGSMDTSVSPRTVSFKAASPDAAAPAAQTVTATFGSDIAQLSVIHNGRAIADVRSALTGRTAQITIQPPSPTSVGAGVFDGTVAVTGQVCADATCSSLIAGNTQTVSVTYQVSPAVGLVMPHVATAGRSEAVVVRGSGFRGFTVSGVRFGTTPAIASTVVSDTEIHATPPALAAGNHEVQVDFGGHQGAITSTATLAVVEPLTLAATTLSYPATGSLTIQDLLYDAERGALLVATNINGGSIVRYAYADGAWNDPSSVAISQLRNIALSPSGQQLLAVSNTALMPMDPSSLVSGTVIAAPSLAANNFLKDIAVANDDKAVVATGTSNGESSATKLYTYDIRTKALSQSSATLNNATAAAAPDGSRIVLMQGTAKTTSDLAVSTYTGSTSSFGSAIISLKQTSVAPAVDRAATRIALNGVKVYGSDFGLLGTLPATTLAVAFRPDGKRAYTYDSAAAAVLTFDTSTSKKGAAFPRIGSATALAGNPGTGLKMTISPDGNTLFLAGSTQIVIQPTPSL